MLVRVTSVTHVDFYQNCTQTKRGDVVVVVDDGWTWGRMELANDDWRVLKLPNISVSQASTFLAPEPLLSPGVSRTRQARAFALDLDRIPQADHFAEGKRGQDAIMLDLSVEQLDALKIRRLPVPDHHMIGDETAHVIG